MQGTLHAYMMPDVKAALQMMKFALNYPERFHSWWSAFFLTWMKLFMLVMLELSNGVIICGQCEVILTVIMYVGLIGLQHLDFYCFKSFPIDYPFKRIILAGSDDLPAIFNIDKTTSIKNNFSG
jgi:hypothetical protein